MYRAPSHRLVAALLAVAFLTPLPSVLASPRPRPGSDSQGTTAVEGLRSMLAWIETVVAKEGCLIDPGGVCRAERTRPDPEGGDDARSGAQRATGSLAPKK